jgi:hypothetical protein
LRKAKVAATQRYHKLIASDGSSTEDSLSKLEISTSNSEVSASNSQQYTVVDKNGMEISGQPWTNYLVLKLETISQLITEVEETQNDIAPYIAHATQATDHSGIWEKSLGTDDRHYRHTAITRHPQASGTERVRGHTTHPHPIPQHATHQHPIRHEYEMDTRIRGFKLSKLGLEWQTSILPLWEPLVLEKARS